MNQETFTALRRLANGYALSDLTDAELDALDRCGAIVNVYDAQSKETHVELNNYGTALLKILEEVAP